MLPDRIRSLTYLLSRLPGVGEKTAQRFALHFVTENMDLASELGTALSLLREHIGVCSRCGNIAETSGAQQPICSICADTRRDSSLLCVVARVQDVIALERSSAMGGRYFILGRLLSPLDGIGPDELPLDQLKQRLAEDGVTEVILATPPSVDGEATALLIARELANTDVKISRIASGLPHGGDLEFADQITLGRAISGRRGVVVDE